MRLAFAALFLCFLRILTPSSDVLTCRAISEHSFCNIVSVALNSSSPPFFFIQQDSMGHTFKTLTTLPNISLQGFYES